MHNCMPKVAQNSSDQKCQESVINKSTNQNLRMCQFCRMWRKKVTGVSATMHQDSLQAIFPGGF